MLNKKICFHCLISCAKKNEATEKSLGTKITDEQSWWWLTYLRRNFRKNWKQGNVTCSPSRSESSYAQKISPYDKAPSWCPYILEQTVSTGIH